MDSRIQPGVSAHSSTQAQGVMAADKARGPRADGKCNALLDEGGRWMGLLIGIEESLGTAVSQYKSTFSMMGLWVALRELRSVVRSFARPVAATRN